MFAKKPHVDVKKSIQKILDGKKDTFSRLKHLKQCLELREFEAKIFFEKNYREIYFIFFETISNLDIAFKQKSQKQSKEEQDVCLFIFEKILVYLPETLNKGWQQHSIGFLLQRLLHHQNSVAIRCEGLRLFLIWYQILNSNAKQNVHHMFATLVPGIVLEIPNPFLHNITNSQLQLNSLSTSIPIISNIDPHNLDAHQSQRLNKFQPNLNESTQSISNHLANQQVYNLNYNNLNYNNNVPANLYVNNSPIIAADIEPMIPSFTLEHQPKDYTIFYLQHLLNYMVNQVSKIQWTENRKLKHRQCFRFLFEQFSQIYLKNIFIELDDKFSFYEPDLNLPSPRIIALDEKLNFNNKRFQYSNTLLDCKARVIIWFAKFMKSNQIDLVKKEKVADRTSSNFMKLVSNESFNQNDFATNKQNNSLNSQLVDPTPIELEIVYSFLTSTRANVNLVHQILNQAFLMPFWQSETMREVVGVYREWIYKNYNQVPIFLKEPSDNHDENSQQNGTIIEDVGAGLSSFHRIFITYSANVFLLTGVPTKRTFLDEQVEMCKRVLNVYRYMVMKVEMDKKTWEQLLLVVLKITSIVLTEQLPIKKEDTLGGRLAPAFFETLIVTWIKANLNIFVSMDLWEKFQSTLKSLTEWEELIKEWARTMDTLTRVMSRYVYNINLLDLPLDRPINRKNKRQISRNKTVGQVNFSPKVHNLNNSSSTNEDGTLKAINHSTSNDDSNSTSNHQQQFSESTELSNNQFSRFNQSIKSTQSNQSNQLNHSAQSSDEKQRQSSSVAGDDKFFHKSFSDSNLLKMKQDENQKMIKLKVNDEFKSYMENFAGFDRDCDAEIERTINHRTLHLKTNLLKQSLKSKSLINISTFNILANHHDLESEVHSLNQSRSPSPISCTNLETNLSLKESPLNFDGISISTNNNHSQSNHHNQQQLLQQNNNQLDQNRSVIIGGTFKNWSPDSAVILWRRMLGILGDVNEFKNSNLHTVAFHCLNKIVEDFIRIRDNLGIVIDQMGNILQNQDYHPTHVPPLDYFVSWLFEATFLNDDYKQGRLIAYRLLCVIATKKHESLMESSNEFLPMFYHTIHNGLNSGDREVISVIIKSCKARLFTLSLPGSSSLLYDFTSAAKFILNSNEIKDSPRYESLSLLSTLIGMNEIYQQVNSLSPSELNPSLIINRNHTNFVFDLLIKAAKKEQTTLGRSMALNALGIYLYQQLSLSNQNNLDSHFLPIINVLIGCTKFPNRILSRNAGDIIRLQIDYSNFILEKYPMMITIIIEGLISSIRYHMDIAEKQNAFRDYQNLLLSLLICLCEWCLAVPSDFLKLTQSTSLKTESVLFAVLKLLNDLSNYNLNSGILNSPFFSQNQNSFLFKKCFEEDCEIDYTIEIDNLVENTTTLKRTVNKFDSQKPNLEFSSSTSSRSINGNNKQQTVDDLAVIWMAASMLTNHLLNFVGNFPLAVPGPSKLSCCLNEYDDNPYLMENIDQNELSIDLFNSPNIIFFIVNNSSIISFVDLTDSNHYSSSNTPVNNQKKSFINEKGKLRVFLRDLTGKFSWTCSNVHSINKKSNANFKNVEKNFETNLSHLHDDDLNQTDEQRPDPLELLIQHLNETSPECTINNNNSQHNSLNSQRRSFSNNNSQQINNQIEQAEENMMALLVNQHYQEMNYAEKLSESQSTLNLNKQNALNYQEKIERCFEVNNIPTEFLNCRQFIDQIGFLNWEKRTKIELLAKNERVLRELRNLDKQKCRETHKIAVIYVKEGQEDKHSILSNQCGSKEFEQFVDGLGWEVDLSKHLGFRGGLESNLSTGKTAVYYANSFLEVIFHVSTRIPSTSTDDESSNSQSNTDCLNKKLRHLGNDEIHIVWSEHYRNYRRGIIPTEFCDVLIVIYPIVAYPGYYRVTISRQKDMPFFGPLFNEAVVHLNVLAGLIRATAINASRTQRSQIPMYKHFFEERNQCLQNIFKQHKELTSFESFASTVYAPKQQQVTGNSFFSNSILQQQKSVPATSTNTDQQSNEQNNSKNLNRLINQSPQELKKSFNQQPIIKNEHLERPNIKLLHQNSEPVLRQNQQRSPSVSLVKNTNHHDILHLKHHPMMEK